MKSKSESESARLAAVAAWLAAARWADVVAWSAAWLAVKLGVAA